MTRSLQEDVRAVFTSLRLAVAALERIRDGKGGPACAGDAVGLIGDVLRGDLDLSDLFPSVSSSEGCVLVNSEKVS